MIYGLYLSATGVLTNSYRQDVIANNLANSETVGFKRSLAIFQQRRTEAQQRGRLSDSDPMLESIGGGTLVSPTYVDRTQGDLDETGSNLDVAVHGEGFFAVKTGNATQLTRNGRFLINREGALVLSDGEGSRVLDDKGKPIELPQVPASQISIGPDGTISASGEIVARLGLFDVPDKTQLAQAGGTLLRYSGDAKKLPQASGTLQSGFLERSNVDPTTELTRLIQTQRQLEANANMIRYQDQTLGKLVNEVGKIG
jgi:flagellar basal-body rod protein FlgF